jgi:hypothetical protein
MKLYDETGKEVCSLALSTQDDEVSTHFASGDDLLQLDLPKVTVSFENTKEGLMVSFGLAGTDKTGKALVEYDDVKALRAVPGKGLVGFALKAFR